MEGSVQWEDRIGRRLKLRDVNVLLAVVQSRSMARAAERLAVSQPVVSKAIADLEHTLGVRLLDRSRQGIEPTPYGRALLKRGLAAFDELRQGVKDIEFLADPTAGEVRIGTTTAMVIGLLPIVINRLHRQHPRLVFHVTSENSAVALYRELRERNVDFIIGRLSSKMEEDLTAEPVFQDQMIVVAGAQNRWVGRRKIELAQLLDEPWIMPGPDTLAGALIAKTFHLAGLNVPQAAVVSASIQMYGALLTSGPFLAIYPRSILEFSAKHLAPKILPVRLPDQPTPVGIVTLKNRTLTSTAHLFIDCVREVAKPLAKGRSGENATRSTRSQGLAQREAQRRHMEGGDERARRGEGAVAAEKAE
jgi:DNA-binding transcriptional LysR family regulator